MWEEIVNLHTISNSFNNLDIENLWVATAGVGT